jgi:fumarylacetoacetate (FAA) hydrolase family protein
VINGHSDDERRSAAIRRIWWARPSAAIINIPMVIVLFLGTLFAPTQDRDTPGEGFTHKVGDFVTISSPRLGNLTNTVRLSTQCPEWTFGVASLMRNLAARNLI